MKRLSRVCFPVFPEDGVLRLHGPGPRPRAGVAPRLPGALLVHDSDHLELSTLQGRVEVTVTLEEWDGAPVPGDPGADEGHWEEAAATTVFLRGYVGVGCDVSGRALGAWLSGGSRRYHADIRARRRHAVAERYDRLLRLYRDPQCAEFRLAEDGLRGQEEFLVRLWPAVEAPSSVEHGVRYPTAVSG
ncbi:hypothetical protein ACQEU5_23915 [Marinactinospora thermotolerans]|uniref:Uncharacterized protein n=1 Tax=Marinactinospora thermotolerans DSM 45154 TaxID=1122192 RepID=A0A1T4K9I8_9ACTN|nr:hypothetical protein [Marinactinospora thermotolerans]SJZ38975.1 hypothetical protein SAMN02745673_00247 [Marinactinospora thermotolerans DSM 45154]